MIETRIRDRVCVRADDVAVRVTMKGAGRKADSFLISSVPRSYGEKKPCLGLDECNPNPRNLWKNNEPVRRIRESQYRLRVRGARRASPRVPTSRRAFRGARARHAMAVSRAPRSPQKAMAILLGLALVFSLLLIAVSRDSDLHVVHDRAGGHFEHDHHRVFESLRGASSLHGGVGGGHLARARPGHLASGAGAHGVFSSHRPDGATVGGSRANFGEARAGAFGGAGAVGEDGSSARSRVAFEAARGGDREGDVDDLFRPVPGASSRGGRVSDDRHGDAADFADDDERPDPDPFVVPAKQRERASSSWMHEVWDETKHLTHEVEKFALGRVGTSGKRDAEAARGAEDVDDGRFDVGSSAKHSSHSQTFADADVSREPSHKASAYAVSGADPENDDLDFANELRMRPREVDDEAEDAEIEAADDAQQKLFDAEAIETSKPAKKGWW